VAFPPNAVLGDDILIKGGMPDFHRLFGSDRIMDYNCVAASI
jgi:hypothetical protein